MQIRNASIVTSVAQKHAMLINNGTLGYICDSYNIFLRVHHLLCRHCHGTKRVNGEHLPKDQRILQRKTWVGVPGMWIYPSISIYLFHTIHMYSGITSGRVLNGELLYTNIVEVNLFAFGYRLFRRDFSPLDGTLCPVEWGEISTKQSVGKCKQINFYNLCVYIYFYIIDSHCRLLFCWLTHITFCLQISQYTWNTKYREFEGTL